MRWAASSVAESETQPGKGFVVPPLGGQTRESLMTLTVLNALAKTGAGPAEAGTPNPGIAMRWAASSAAESETQPGKGFVVPPLGGQTRESLMTLTVLNALSKTGAGPAEAGTPNH